MRPAPGQQSLFPAPRTGQDEYTNAPVPLNASVPPHEAPRLSTQHHAILARLTEGPATNAELGRICQRFGARLEELKRAGYHWIKRCLKPGVYQYTLVGLPPKSDPV